MPVFLESGVPWEGRDGHLDGDKMGLSGVELDGRLGSVTRDAYYS